MKNKLKNIVGLIILMLAATGCRDEKAEEEGVPVPENIPGWQQHAADEVTLDWYVNFSWFTTPFGGNVVSEKITEETGININFLTPRGSEAEKFNALISSKSLPDLITLCWWENQLDEMITGEMVYPLNELADEYDPYFWEVADGQVINWYTKEDGNVYCYPNSFYVPSDYEENDNIGSNQTFLVRKDIYEAIGSPDMTTAKGFKEAVRKAAEMFPEIDGYPLIPIGAHEFNDVGCVSFDQYLQNFLAIPYEKGGKYYDRYTDTEYVDWLKTFRELGAEGYLKQDIFIDQRLQMEEKIARGQYFCMLFQRTDLLTQQAELYARNPDSVYIAVDGPRNSRGDDYCLPGAGINGWTVTLISKNCERPDRAIELFSYLMSDRGQMLTFLGVEGVTYDMAEGKPAVRPEIQAMIDNNRLEYDRLYGAAGAYWMFQDNARLLKWRQPLSGPGGQMEEWTYPYSHYLAQYETSFDAKTEAGNADMNIKKLWSTVLPKLLLAPTEEEFNRIFAEFKEERDKLGFDIVQQENTRQMIETKEILGMK